MYERLLDKNIIPDETTIINHLGKSAYSQLIELENILNKQYNLKKELKFPFGNNYGWGYKYSHKTSHICYVFFEKDAYTVMLQIGDSQVPDLDRIFPSLSTKTKSLWHARYPCGKNGGCIHYRVLYNEDLSDIIKLINVKKKPILKQLNVM